MRFSNGTVHYGYQCLRCGRLKGSYLPHADVKRRHPPYDDPPAWDKTLEERFYEAAHAASEQQRLAVSKERDAQWQERRAEYSDYLLTAEWRAKRETVLKRENYVCQGCRQRRATQVHHTTYRHIGHELLFELVALCEACHEIAHGSASDEDIAKST